MTATAEATVVSREIPGIGRLDFEPKPHDYFLLPEGRQRRISFPTVTEILRATWPAGESLLNWYGNLGVAKAREARNEAAAIGTDTHRFIETFLRTGALLGFGHFPENRKPFLQGAARFLIEHEPRPVTDGIERLVCHPELRYAGRLDLLCVLKDCGALTLLDYKTSAGGNLYAKHHAQLAGYSIADHRCGGERIERYGVVGINGEGHVRIVWTPVDEAVVCWKDIVTYYGSMRALLKELGEA